MKIKIMCLVAASLLVNIANADCLSNITAGKDYLPITIDSVKTIPMSQAEQKSNKPELIEFFWYGCPHCYHMEDLVNNLVKEHKDTINFKRYPVIFPRWESGAQLFFTIEEMGLVEKLHTKIFNTIQKEHINIMDDKVKREAFLKKEGVNVTQFNTIYDSFNIAKKMRQGKEMASNYHLASSPVFIINNKYQVDPAMAGGYEATVKNLDSILNTLTHKEQCLPKKH
jgi:thiol:disulfide interchange protein DsbA